MSRASCAGWIVVAAALAAPLGVQAQAAPVGLQAQAVAHARQGAWFSVGPAYVTAWSTGPYSGRHRVEGGALRLGGGWGVNQAVQVGVGLTAPVAYDPAAQDETIDISLAATGVLRAYPSPTAGLYLSGGLGVGAVRTTDEPGFAVEAGIGYDLSLGRHASLTPQLNVLRIGDRYRPTTYGQLGLAVTVD